ncbi:MAG: type VI secretion system baseplate subunit TssG [Gammaproteobacteria bacterium]|nr:type VI secretion system baseplate subunit TssG [Gammaproteobacteria bacterium]
MAAPGRRKNLTVAEELFDEAYRFDFYQAVKLFEHLAPESSTPLGEDALPETEPVRLRSHVSVAFPASDVESASPAEDGLPPALSVNAMGLAGAHGPLPPPYTELIMERAWRGDTALRDFLDIFNRRLLSLLYRARKEQRIGMEVVGPWKSRFADHLFTFMGLGTKGLRNRMQIADHPLLFYAGLFVHQSRSLSALEVMLADFFQVRVAGEPWAGQWQNLPEDEYTRIGAGWQKQILGRTAVLGTRVWDQQSKFILQFGPMGIKQFLTFLPMGSAFVPLCELTRFFTGGELDFDLSLKLNAAEIPQMRLDGAAYLGWTSWLKAKSPSHNACVKLSPKLLFFDKEKKSHIPLLALLPKKELDLLMDKLVEHNLPAGTVVIRQGMATKASLFLISSGIAHVAVQEHGGGQRILNTLEQGAFFGEMSFLTGKPYSASVITATTCRILELPNRRITKLVQKYPEVEMLLRMTYERRAGQ